MKEKQINEFHQHFTLKELMDYGAKAYGDSPAFIYAEKKKDVVISYKKFKEDVDCLGTWMFRKGYEHCQVAVFGENSYQWIMTYFAVTCGKNVIVPIDKDLPAREVADLLAESNCRAMFYSSQYADIAEEIEKMNPGSIGLYNMKDFPKLLAEGKQYIEEGHQEYLNAVVKKEDLASIVFTSGTSGKSKGVMLSHNNFCSNTYGSCDAVDIKSGTALLLLPLHHTFGLVTNVFSAISYGYPVYINRSLKRLAADFQKVQPCLLCAVPLVVETMYKTIWDTARKQGKEQALKKLIKFSDLLLKCGIDLRRKLFKSVLAAFGGNLELIISGGAPLDEKYIRVFRSFGIVIQNGYGITECSPVVSVTRGKGNHSGSVGIPLCCNQIKISPEGEILVKGDNVMMGYYNNDEENAKVLKDGWFRTGDIGHIDSQGELHVTGRIKNLIILSNGENISAEAIEEQIYTIPYVKEAVAYGKDGVIVAEVYLDEEAADAREQIHKDIKAINRNLSQVKNIAKVIIRDTEFPKTSTKKIKRAGFTGQQS